MSTLLKDILQRLDELKRVTQFRADDRTVEAAKGIVAALFASAERGGYEIRLASNNWRIGDLVCEADGEWYFWPTSDQGHWPAHLMRAVIEELDRLNGRKK